jgi:hypothetical protein
VADKGGLYRYTATCLDALSFNGPSSRPTTEKLADAVINLIRNVSPYFGISVTLCEPNGGCKFWAVKGVKRFSELWNHILAFPVLIASTPVSDLSFIMDGLTIWSIVVG